MPRPRARRQSDDPSPRRARVETEYDNFMNSNDDDPERARRFSARHTAAKVALSHIEALQKIEGNPRDDTTDNSTAMVAHARAALAQENILDESEADD